MPPFKSEYYWLLATKKHRFFFFYSNHSSKPILLHRTVVKISKVKTPKVASKTTVKPPVTQRRDSTPNRKRGTVAEAKTPAPLTVPLVRNPTNLRIGKGWGKGNLMMWLESLIQLILFKRVGWMIMDKIASGKKDWNWHGEKQFFFGESWKKWIICSLLHFTDC